MVDSLSIDIFISYYIAALVTAILAIFFIIKQMNKALFTIIIHFPL